MFVHIQKDHNRGKKVQSKVSLFANIDASSSEGQSSKMILKNIHLRAPSGEESRGGRIRTTPYERNSDSSSRSPSPARRPVPLQISLSHLPLSTLSSPSPLTQLAFSRSNSPPASDDEMNVDKDEEQLFSDDQVFEKGSLVIVPLHHIQTVPPTQLITCSKCSCGISPSLAISHVNQHRIKLTKAERKKIQSIIDHGNFAKQSSEVDFPPFPCSPVEGITVQDGFICNLCNFCCPSDRTMMTHFSTMHKGSKSNSNTASIQAYFAYRPKYFPVVPCLRGLNKDDLFAIYLQQCAPEIEALKILNPPRSPHEVPPLLKVTQWHEHLKDHTADRDKVRKLLELTALPTSNRGESWLGLPLRATIEGYMKNVRVKANNASLGIKCLLKDCPRFVAPSMLGFIANKY